MAGAFRAPIALAIIAAILAGAYAEPFDARGDYFYRDDRQGSNNGTTAPPPTSTTKPTKHGITLGTQALIAFGVLAGLCLLVFLHNWCMSQSSEEFRKNVQNDLDVPDDNDAPCWDCCSDTADPEP